MSAPTIPDYAGRSLVNLVAELEQRLRGSAESPGLTTPLAASIPTAETYVLVLFDGLGAGQLDHPAAAGLSTDLVAAIDAPFPTTTTVSLASVATGRPPSQHGLLGYQLWLPEAGAVVNTIKWTTLWGDAIDVATGGFLPAPNLWERLRAAGCEPITVQPGNFTGTPLSSVMYRGCRFEGAYSIPEWVDAVVTLAGQPGRLIFAYLPHVDFAAHVAGQGSVEYRDAVTAVTRAWTQLTRRLPVGAVAVGTADHGHADFPDGRRVKIPKQAHEQRRFFGDARVVFVRGEGASLAAELPATWRTVDDMRHWWGHGPAHPEFDNRAPDGVLVADDGYVILHRRSDDRLVGNHGGLTDAERLVPLAVAGAGG